MRYDGVARMLHWLTVLLVLIMVPVGLTMVQDIPRPTQDRLFILHKNLGPLVFFVVAIRLLWRGSHTPPPLPASVTLIQRSAAHGVHWALYAVLLAMPISGYIRVTAGGYPIELFDRLGIPPLFAKNEALGDAASSVHAVAGIVLIVLVALHVAAASYHAIARQDGVFSRMWPPFRN